jgi:hydrogenase 3 maturation protease
MEVDASHRTDESGATHYRGMMLAELSTLIEGKHILLLGVGNRLRGDDAIGPLLIERLQGQVNIPLLDVGDVPENYLGPIEESGAELVLVVDAVEMGADAGDTAIIDIEQIQNMSVSTHTANLGLLFKVIPPEKRPQVVMLGIQTGNIELGQELSEPMRTTLESLKEMLIASLQRDTHD